MREVATEVAFASRQQWLQQLDRDLADARCERLHLGLREEAVQDAAVRSVLGRVEVQRRPTSCEGNAGHDVLHGRREGRWITENPLDVGMAGEHPKAVPGRAVCDWAFATQPPVLPVSALECPVAYSSAWNGFWMLTRHAD